jgi:3-oxoadipate enol-lactonase
MKSITLSVSQAAVTYRAVGTGPVVVLLHAFPLDSGMFESQTAALKDRYRVIAPDLPGFGGSDGAAGWSVDGAAERVSELLDHLGVQERVVVGGVSMGGYVSLAFARLYPQRTRALILADTKADPDDEQARAGRDKMIQLVTENGVSAVVEQTMPKLVSSGTLTNKPEVVANVRELAGRQKSEGVAAALAALRDRPDARPGLPHVSCPTLVMVGEHDGLTPPDKAKEMTDGIPNARLLTIPTAGHLSNLENPTAFNAGVREFLDSLPDNAGIAGPV